MNLIITALLFNFLITGHSLMNPSCHTRCPCEGGAHTPSSDDVTSLHAGPH